MNGEEINKKESLNSEEYRYCILPFYFGSKITPVVILEYIRTSLERPASYLPHQKLAAFIQLFTAAICLTASHFLRVKMTDSVSMAV